jgi:hypothetical protein
VKRLRVGCAGNPDAGGGGVAEISEGQSPGSFIDEKYGKAGWRAHRDMTFDGE